MYNSNESQLIYPNGKDFAFSIFDDTDVSTLEYIRPIYDRLTSLGLITTKSVWPLRYDGESDFHGSNTLEDEKYALYINELRDRNYEIAFHGPTMVSSNRENTLRAFDVFWKVIGSYPRIYAPHSLNRENLYWGSFRLSTPLLRSLFKELYREPHNYYLGHKEGSQFFWGDICLRHIDYVRNFTFDEVNLLRINDIITYENPSKRWVKKWFYTADADNVEEFNRILCDKNQDRLQQERGVCILSTHLGKGFIKGGRLLSETDRLLKRLCKLNGWYVPVSVILDFLSEQQTVHSLSTWKEFILELKWLVHSIRRKRRSLEYEKCKSAS